MGILLNVLFVQVREKLTKEHESKEETLEDAGLRIFYQSADQQDFENKTGNYKEVSNMPMDEELSETDKRHIRMALYEKEEPVSVEESKVREITAAVFENKSETIPLKEKFKDYLVNHLKKDSFIKEDWINFRNQYNWQKQQSDAIIVELLKIAKEYDANLNGLSAQRRLNESGLIFHKHIKSEITKATNYLNQQ